ncbi:MAG: DUF262 domain-containing protein [Planctomycetes bacterium]|nr:DUF262 domain-containing protein [Planctomycetota bacterium]
MATSTWTVQQIVEKEYGRLGVPHFQRGLVWNKDSVARLLESLYYDTPCGTLILWKPLRIEDEGIPLPGSRKIEYLIIDGQQRIRSLHDAISGLSTETPDADPGEGSGGEADAEVGRVWCLNLTRIPELSDLLKDDLLDFPFFMKVRDPRTEVRDPRRAGPARFRFNLVPLSEFFGSDGHRDLGPLIKPSGPVDVVLRRIREIGLERRVQAIRERTFPILIKNEERGGENGLVDLVQMYNRINSSGVRVEAEERAYATLVAIRRDVVDGWMRGLFRKIHDEGVPREGTRLERDDVLRRTKEKNFGFKFFVRTLVQTCNYYLQQGLGTSALSFDALNKPSTLRNLRGKENAERFGHILKDSERLITYISEVVRDDLKCDSFAFLPDTSSFAPTFQLLLKYPLLAERGEYRPLVRLFVLKALLANLNQRDLLKLVDKVRRTNEVNECAGIIKDVAIPPLSKVLAGANSLQNRYVLLLYWLLRQRGARDFDYRNLPKGTPPGLKRHTEGTRGVPVEAGFSPEKQHVVPYHHLEEIYGLKDGSRQSTHPANNIGNLTYISHDENECFEGGLGHRPIRWEHDDLSNLRSHFLVGDREEMRQARTWELYGAVLDPQGRDRKAKFEEFCRLRAGFIANRFGVWLRELEAAVPALGRMEPSPPPFAPTIQVQDRVRAFDLDNDLEDEILALLQMGPRISKRKDFPLCLGFFQPMKTGKRQVVQIRLRPEDAIIKFNDLSAEVAQTALKAVGPDRTRDQDKVLLPVRGPESRLTLAVLKAISLYLGPRRSGVT